MIEEKAVNICKCPGVCEYRKSEVFNIAKDEQPKPDKSLKDLVFGDEIEVRNEDSWETVKFISISGSYVWGLPQDHRQPKARAVEFFNWRLPVKSRMRKGQPVWVGGPKILRLFSHFDGDDIFTLNGSVTGGIGWKHYSSPWRLPTKAELEAIGHADGGWLTQD